MTDQSPPPPPPPGAPGSDGSVAAADVGVRAGARVIDAILLTIVVGILTAIVIVPIIVADAATDAPGMMSAFTGGGLSGASIISSLVGLAINFAYYIGLDTSMGGTLGKKMLSLKIVGADGGGNPSVEESFKRNAWLLLSVIPFVGGLLQLGAAIYILVTISNDPSNVGWHDRFAGGTRVVKT